MVQLRLNCDDYNELPLDPKSYFDMALIRRGKTPCRLCHKIILVEDETAAFGVAIMNSNDSLGKSNDAPMDKRCFDRDPDSKRAQTRWDEMKGQIGVGHRICSVCNEEILNHHEYFTIGPLVFDSSQPLFRYNYTQLHRPHIAEWSDRLEVIGLLQQLEDSGEWGGLSLARMIGELKINE